MGRRRLPEMEVAERVLQILDDGVYTTTYKQAVLVGLLDLCLELTEKNGEPPESVSTRQLAEKVVALYWPQTKMWGGDGEPLHLRQIGRGSQATIVSDVRLLRESISSRRDTAVTLERARIAAADHWEKVVRATEKTLVSMPLPKLQRVDDRDTNWLYRVPWDDKNNKPEKGSLSAYQKGKASSFDNLIRFQPGVAGAFVALHGILRPFILQHWASKVARLNGLENARLLEFLFGVDRTSLEPVRQPLLELQRGECFYCGRRMRAKPDVDHFVPWARHPDNALHNLVVAHTKCNGGKRDHLASSRYVERWRQRSLSRADELEQVARECRWEGGSKRILGVARGIYLNLPDDARLWELSGFVSADRQALRTALQ